MLQWIKLLISSKILYVKVRCPIYGLYFLLDGKEEEEERIKYSVISFLAFHANVRFIPVVTGSSRRKKTGSMQAAGLWEPVLSHFFAEEAARCSGKSRITCGGLDLSLNHATAT